MKTVKGVANLKRALHEVAQLDQRAGRRVIASGLRAGNKVILTEIKSKLAQHRKSGDLEKSYVQRARTRGGIPQNNIGVTDEPAGWRWHFLEYGTKYADAYPHVRNSTDQKMSAAERKSTQVISKGLERNLNRLKAKFNR